MSESQSLVVVVDDDIDCQTIVSLHLEAAGYAVRCFDSPTDALEFLTSHRPVLLITDLVMGSLTAGFDLVKACRERMPDLAIMIMTSASTTYGYDFAPRTEQDRTAMQVNAFLNKPIHGPQLLQTVRSLLQAPG